MINLLKQIKAFKHLSYKAFYFTYNAVNCQPGEKEHE